MDYRRHFSCEYCEGNVTGGYDPKLNQIVVCYNKCRSKRAIQSIIGHELIHMFDYCRAHFDFNNIEHVACSEVYFDTTIHDNNNYQ